MGVAVTSLLTFTSCQFGSPVFGARLVKYSPNLRCCLLTVAAFTTFLCPGCQMVPSATIVAICLLVVLVVFCLPWILAVLSVASFLFVIFAGGKT